MKEKILNEIQDQILYSENIWQACETVLSFILSKSEDAQVQYFHVFIQENIIIEKARSNPKEFFDTSKYKNYISTNKSIVDNIVSALVRRKLTENAFYQSLWDRITTDDLFVDTNSKIAFIVNLNEDNRIPYYQISDGITMEEEEFDNISDNLTEKIQKAYFILNARLAQRTQVASLLDEIAETISDSKSRAVYWANILLIQSECLERELEEIS